jgi:radical SAM superfamily enzyme YgiQ (UPF0313 family)
MKILLCNPIEDWQNVFNHYTPPLNLGFIAGTLEKDGYEVRIVDNYLESYLKLKMQTYESFLKQVKKYDPDVLGISCLTEDRFWAFKMANIIKETFPHVKVVFGGPFSTPCHKQILEDIPSVDIVVRGEGELTFLDIVKHIEKNEDINDVKGITYRDGENIKINEDRPFIQNLDELPWPAFHLLDINKYPKRHNKKHGGLIFGRGCPFDCLFCASKVLLDITHRIIAPKNAISQIKFLVDEGCEFFTFYDDSILLNKKWFKKFIDEIKREKLDIEYQCHGRVDSIDQGIAEDLKSSGCRHIFLGVENGSPHVLKLIRKEVGIQQAEKAVKILYKNKVDITPGHLVNIPGQTFEDITTDLKFFKKLNEKYSVNSAGLPGHLEIYPGTDVERIALRNGLLSNFRWTQSYFEKRNLLIGASPYVPLYQNMRTEDVMKYTIKECLRLEWYHPLNNVVSTIISSYLQINDSRGYEPDNFLDRFKKGTSYLSWLSGGINTSASLEKKAKHIYNLLNEMLKLTFPKKI